eukprot:14286680-Alexandrium_andersonii.AAC.1
MARRVNTRELTTSCIPVYDILALAGLAVAQSREGESVGTGSTTRLVLRPAMSYQHGLATILHPNLQTLLRRDGYPVTWSMLSRAWRETVPYINERIKDHSA